MFQAPTVSTNPKLRSGLKKNMLLCGASLREIALMISWLKTPPTIAHTGLTSENTELNNKVHKITLTIFLALLPRWKHYLRRWLGTLVSGTDMADSSSSRIFRSSSMSLSREAGRGSRLCFERNFSKTGKRKSILVSKQWQGSIGVNLFHLNQKRASEELASQLNQRTI